MSPVLLAFVGLYNSWIYHCAFGMGNSYMVQSGLKRLDARLLIPTLEKATPELIPMRPLFRWAA